MHGKWSVAGVAGLLAVGVLSGCEEKAPPSAPPVRRGAEGTQEQGSGEPSAPRGTATTPPTVPPGTGAPQPPTDPELKEAAALFAARCALCHGPLGAGDGPASAAFIPRPRNLREPAWQASAKDEAIEKIIVGGGPSVGMSAAMPPNPDLAGKPIVPQLRKLIRSFEQK